MHFVYTFRSAGHINHEYADTWDLSERHQRYVRPREITLVSSYSSPWFQGGREFFPSAPLFENPVLSSMINGSQSNPRLCPPSPKHKHGLVGRT